MIQIATGDPRPISKQIVDGIRLQIASGELELGAQLPSVRGLATQLVINPNTVAKAYRELEHEGVIELRHGAGAFVSAAARGKKAAGSLRAGQTIVAGAIEKLRQRGLSDEEIRRLFEAELAGLARAGGQHG
jgi:GntR family transcriptional regulator